MKRLKYLAISTKLRFALIALLTVLLISQTAIAQATQQGRIYKDITSAIFLYGLQPGEQIQAASDFAPARYITSNACGLLIIKRSKTKPVGKIRLEGNTIDPATLPTQLIPSCQGITLAEARQSPFKTAIGDVVLPKTANRRYQILMLTRPPLRVVKANSCGFLRFPGGALGDQPILPTATGGLARFAVNQLPEFPQLLCKSKKLYVPPNFPPQLAMSISPFNPDQWEPSSPTGQNGDGSQEGDGSSGSGSSGSGSSGSGSSGSGTSNQPPTISPISPQTFNGTTEQVISFTIADPDTPLDQIQLSSNVASFPNDFEYGNFAGTGANRTLTIKPKRSSSNVPIQISVGDGTHTTSQGLQVGFVVNPPIPIRICRTATGFFVPRLEPSRSYKLGFDDWVGSYPATSNTSGNADFPVPSDVIPQLDDWSEGDRRGVVYDVANNYNDVDYFYLSQTPPC